MWLDQDLLKMSEKQRRSTASGTLTNASGRGASGNAGGFQLSNMGGEQAQNPATSDKGAQAHGYAKGFASGWAAGQRRAAREATEQLARLEEEARLAEEARTEAFADSMDQVASLAAAVQDRDELVVEEMKEALAAAAIELAEALLGAELSSGPAGAKAALYRALSVGDPKEIVRVHMNPNDVEALQKDGVESPVELIADPSMEPGDAIAQMPEGFLDARLSSAIERARAALAATQEVGGELQ